MATGRLRLPTVIAMVVEELTAWACSSSVAAVSALTSLFSSSNLATTLVTLYPLGILYYSQKPVFCDWSPILSLKLVCVVSFLAKAEANTVSRQRHFYCLFYAALITLYLRYLSAEMSSQTCCCRWLLPPCYAPSIVTHSDRPSGSHSP